MPSTYAMSGSFAEESGLRHESVAPRPSTIAAQESLNPIPKLLLSFPVPRLVTQMHLETAWPTAEEDDSLAGAAASATAASHHGGWGTAELDDVVRGMQQSAQELLLTGGYTHFLQEQLHHEITAPTHQNRPSSSINNNGNTSSSSAATPGELASLVSAAVAPGLRQVLTTMGQQSAMLSIPRQQKSQEESRKAAFAAGAAAGSSVAGGPPSRQRIPLTRVPKTELWARSEESSSTMSLRPRRSSELGGAWAEGSSESLDSTAGGATAAAHAVNVRRSGGVSAVSTSATASPLATSYAPRTGSAVASVVKADTSLPQEGGTAGALAALLHQRDSTSDAEVSLATFQSLIAALPLQLHPFAGIEPATLSAFLDSLLTASSKEETEAGNTALQWSTRGLLCCQCLAHPHFPTAAVSDGVVSRVIDVFGRVVRDVAGQLQEAEQQQQQAKSTVAAPAAQSGDEEGDGRRRPSGGGRRGTGSASTSGEANATSALVSSLELLRGFIGGFAPILCNSNLRLAAETDVLRLEELCHWCLFRLTRSCTKALHTLYASYVVDLAVQLYRSIWNRLSTQRQSTVESFFQQLSITELLTQRTYLTNVDGRAVLPLTVAMLAAAQSTPLPPDAVTTASAEALQRQCGLWATCFVQNLLLSAGREREKAEEVVAWAAAVRVAEDLVDLLGVPEWPGADLLLRSIVMALAQLTLGGEASSSAPAAEALRPLAIDVLGSVAVCLFDAQRFPVASAILAEMERLGESASTSPAAARVALQHVMPSPLPYLEAEDQQAWAQLCDSAADDKGGADAPEEHHRLRELMAAVYVAESKLIASSTTAVDYAAAWWHIRAARLLTWVCHRDATEPEWIPSSSLNGLVRWRRPSGGSSSLHGSLADSVAVSQHAEKRSGQPTNWGDVCGWVQAIGTQSSKSMLSLRMRHTLVSMLFSVFHLKDAQGAAVAVTDGVQKKTLAHLARLTALHPALHRYLWPIVRQCVRDDSARVRESIVPLLLTLLSDAADAEADADGGAAVAAAGQLPTTLTADGVAAEVISSLLHLLNDKSVAVVSRTIAALDTFLTDPNYHYLFATPQGASLLSFIQQKLLCFAGPTAEPKHRQEVVRHFLHRWVVTLADSDGSLTGAHAQLAKELVALTVMGGSTDFPYDVADEHPLVQVLQGMFAYVQVHDPATAGLSHNSARGTAAPPPHRRRARGCTAEAAQLVHVMRCAAQSLWMRYQCFHSCEDAVACLAALRVLALSRCDWVLPLAEVLVQSLAYPPPSTSPLATTAEALGGSLLQLCQILHGVLQSPRLPLISLDYLARCLTTLLSKYVGPYQQRVIVASCGTLSALITCGAKHRLSAQVNVPYLQLCYSLMNTYYCRVRALLPTLASQPQSVAYTQRFLFLLSEFLRNYAGWRQSPPHPALLDDTFGNAGSSGGSALGGLAPNQLAKGLGIAANAYQLIEDVLQSCGSVRERVAVIALRVVASLCMLDPTTYLYRAEPQIRAALRSTDHNLQLQGLSLLSDFLKEEDARVDAASRSAAVLDTTALILGGRASASRSRSESATRDDLNEGNNTAEKPESVAKSPAAAVRRGRKTKQAKQEGSTADASLEKPAAINRRGVVKPRLSATTAAGAAEDFNSGMSTWIFQQFHGDIARLSCGSPHIPVRTQCLRLFQQASQGGLLPPDKYVRVIIALAADVHAPLRRAAAACLASHCDRHEEVVAASVGRGVALAFDLHYACGAHLLRSATVAASSVSEAAGTPANSASSLNAGSGGEQSAHGVLYGLLHKRSRDNMVTTLVRFFYQDGKVAHWREEHATTATATSAAGIFGVMHPLLFLCHVTLVLFTLPFQQDGDVMHVLQQCRAGLDLNGQSALDWLKESSMGALVDDDAAAAVQRWKAVGALLLHYLRRALLAEYRFTWSKVQRYGVREGRSAGSAKQHHGSNNNSGTSAVLRRRDAGQEGLGAAAGLLLTRLETLVDKMRPVLQATQTDEKEKDVDALQSAWHYVSAELEAALLSESAEEFGRVGSSAPAAPRDRTKARERKQTKEMRETNGLRPSRRAAGRPVRATRKRARTPVSTEVSSSSESDESDEASTATTSSSRSTSTARTTASSSLLSQSSAASTTSASNNEDANSNAADEEDF